MRISQRQMFSQQLSQMGNALSMAMEYNLQGGTQKKINRPSDDPANMARVMMFRESLSTIERNKANIGEATGWLNLADHSLMQVSEVISSIKALDLQGATGTLTADQREGIAAQLRGFFGELMNLANTDYNGQYIFGGHKVETPAYVEGLAVTSHPFEKSDGSGTQVNLNDSIDFVTKGGASSSVLIQFTETDDLSNQPDFIFSPDGGKTWQEGIWEPATSADSAGVMRCGGVTIEPKLKDPTAGWGAMTTVEATPGTFAPPVGAEKESMGGTWLTARPTAIYMGDDHDTQTTQQFGPTATGLKAEGSFARDVSVRITSNDGATIEYEYSVDNGSNWIKAKSPATGGAPPTDTLQLAIPGGDISVTAGPFAAGQEFLVHPRRADINFEISPNQTITVNNVGKEIFGGMYQEPFSDYPTTVEGFNLFDTVGKLIAYHETNDQTGIQSCLDQLTECLKVVTTKNADVGGRENRLTTAFQTATIREVSEDTARSAIEDVDVVTLMAKTAQQQLAYNTVLKSSSMIMQMSLMNFI